LLKKTYLNQDYASFGEVVRAFLAEAAVSKPPVTACLAVAGPVKNNIVRFTNRDSWEIDGDKIGEELKIKKVLLINDFVAAGYGVLTLNTDHECITLQRAVKQTTAPIACIGAGTGLGQCFLTPDGESGNYSCFPSEGGHAEFAPRNEVLLRDTYSTSLHLI
jgi:glucokinase